MSAKRSVSALVKEWKALRARCDMEEKFSDDPSAIDALAEQYGEQIASVERLIAETDPEDPDELAAMLDLALDSLQFGELSADEPALRMVRTVRERIHLTRSRGA